MPDNTRPAKQVTPMNTLLLWAILLLTAACLVMEVVRTIHTQPADRAAGDMARSALAAAQSAQSTVDSTSQRIDDIKEDVDNIKGFFAKDKARIEPGFYDDGDSYVTLYDKKGFRRAEIGASSTGEYCIWLYKPVSAVGSDRAEDRWVQCAP
jgi:hypothetical protein